MAVASLANRVQVNTTCSNNDALYGPYTSIDVALASIPSSLIDGEGAIGRTIGVIESGKVVEYWWQPVDGGYGFVKKVDTGTPIVNQTASEVTIQPNVMNVWKDTVSNLKVTKGDAIEGIVNNYMIRFTAGEGCSVTFSGFELDWFGGEEPTWTAGNTYEISIVDNIALWVEIEA
jgi:hypothetical protein